MAKRSQRLDPVADDLGGRQQRHGQERAGHAPDGVPEEQGDDHQHRIEGELVARAGTPGDGESCFRAAIEVARSRGEKSLELRATMRFARLLLEQDRRDEARQALTEIYGWFTEGFDTADLRDAKRLLDQLST